jgi:HEAT repeat protein
MTKPDPIELALDRLGELRHGILSSEVTDEIRRFLANRTNLVVAKAAKLAGESRIAVLVPDLVAAFDRLMTNAPRLDKRCAAITEIMSALYALDYAESAPYLLGIKHVQLEASYGPPVDEAAKLRAVSAQGLLRTHHPDALSEVVQLLVDREPAARIGAVRALATNGGESGVLLLRLKVLTGDAETGVVAECFAGLLSASPGTAVPFLAGYVDSEDDATAEAAVFALGESRLPVAYEVLREKWDRTVGMPRKKILLLSIAATKLEAAIAFLISLVENESSQVAVAAIHALSIYSVNERVKKTVRETVAARGEKALTERFKIDFERLA